MRLFTVTFVIGNWLFPFLMCTHTLFRLHISIIIIIIIIIMFFILITSSYVYSSIIVFVIHVECEIRLHYLSSSLIQFN